eukprot:7186795-Prymnesium_polylepis.1
MSLRTSISASILQRRYTMSPRSASAPSIALNSCCTAAARHRCGFVLKIVRSCVSKWGGPIS